MSSTTSRAAFYKPAGGENINVTTDLNNNLDKLDTNLNFRVVANATARNAISPFWAGLNVRETDTGKMYVSNGSAPISGSWDLLHSDSTIHTADNLTAAATGTIAVNHKAAAESQNRYQIRGDGQVSWGSGAGAVDTNLYRSLANTLKTDDNLIVDLNHTVNGTSSLVGDVSMGGNATVTGDFSAGGIGAVLFNLASGNQSIATTAAANATNMNVSLAASATYTVEIMVFYNGNSASKLRLGFAQPTSSTLSLSALGLVQSVTTGGFGSLETTSIVGQTSSTDNSLTFATTTATYLCAKFHGVIVTGASAGTLQVRASLSTGTSAASIRAGSYIVARRVV